jgi:hypothetical protein
MDSVTNTLELDAGVYPIDAITEWLRHTAFINYDESTSHLFIRQLVMEKLRKPHLLSPAEPLPLSSNPKWLEKTIGLARKYWAAAHVCHLNARADGVDITTKAYP